MTKPIDPAELDGAEPASADGLAFSPVPVKYRHSGWSAERQRIFIQALAETGSVTDACDRAGVTARSAYRLRLRPNAASFDAAWRQALVVSMHRLTTLAFDRAIHGSYRQKWHKGQVVGGENVPSDRLLMYLLKHYDRSRYGNLSGFLEYDVPDPTNEAQAAMPALMAALTDNTDPIPGDGQESFVILPELHDVP